MANNHPIQFDVLIVGAGPAGSHLAYLLARLGYRIGLIDKARFPREKACGGGLSRKATELLNCDLSPVIHRPIGGAFLTFANRVTLIKDIAPPVGVTVMRSEFDAFLVDRAVAAGARLMSETGFIDARDGAESIAVTTTRGEFNARLLIGADGAASAVRRQIFGRGMVRHVPSLEALVPATAATIDRLGDRAVFDFGSVPGGYGWIFPKRDHFNVGVYSPLAGTLRRRDLDQFMSVYACLAEQRDVRRLAAVIPLHNVSGRVQRGRVWLLGDAAGLAESVFGEGIYFALKSAALAAEAIAADGMAAESSRYSDDLRRALLPELRASQTLGKLLYRFPKFTFNHCVINDRINDDFAGMISGRCGYRACLTHTVKGVHRWLWPSRAPPQSVRL